MPISNYKRIQQEVVIGKYELATLLGADSSLKLDTVSAIVDCQTVPEGTQTVVKFLFTYEPTEVEA